MGQYWQVVAFALREKVRFWGKLGEVLFDGSPSCLVLPLAVPILPQGFSLGHAPDATLSPLLGKRYSGRAEDLEHKASSLPEEHGEKFGTKKCDSVKRKRDSCPEPLQREQKHRDLALGGSNNLAVNKSRCGLSALPVELLDMVFRNLDIDHVFALGLQSEYFWNVAWRHIQAYLISSCGSWAGISVICVGEYLKPTDLFPHILSEERGGLQRGFSESELWDDYSTAEEDSKDFVPSPINLYSLAHARYQKVREWDYWGGTRLVGHASLLGDWSRLPDFRYSQIVSELFRYELSDFYPEDQPWILRNLTTQEYVRSEAIAIKPEHIHGPNIDFLGFGEVVWSRICWSTELDCSMDRSDNIHRGVWAGHRLDITTLDRLKQGSLEGTEWKDISEEVADMIERVWRKEFGCDWRDIIQRSRRY